MQRKWVVAGWAAAAVAAAGAGVGAVALAQGGTLAPPSEPMSEQQVLDELASAEASETASPSEGGSASPEPSTSPSPTGRLEEVPEESAQSGEVISEKGGSVLARCVEGGIELVWWVPSQGWRVSSVDPGPGEDAEIEFENDSGAGVDWEVVCVDRSPRVSIDSDSDDDDDDD